MHKRSFVLICGLLLSMHTLQAQISFSPYSRYGIGETYNPVNARNYAMGGAGIALYDYGTINRINPASYADIRLTTFDFSGYGILANQKSNSAETRSGNGGVHNVALAFSSNQNFAIVAGLAPYSSIGYNVVQSRTLQLDTSSERYVTNYFGDGGLNQFYIGTGVKLLKRINLGVNLRYTFGNLYWEAINDFEDGSFATVNVNESASLKGLNVQLGAQYIDNFTWRKSVNSRKLIAQQKANLNAELGQLEKEAKLMDEEEAKLKLKEQDKRRVQSEIREEEQAYRKQVRLLMENEQLNDKEIGRLQEKIFRLEKKNQKIELKIRNEWQEYTAAVNNIEKEKKKKEKELTKLDKRVEAINEGVLDSVERRESRIQYRIGLVFEPSAKLNGSYLKRVQTITPSSFVFTDTAFLSTTPVTLPSRFGFGASLSRPNKWILGADVSMQNWKQFDFYEQEQSLASELELRLGGEWIPDIKTRNFAQRLAYRLGAYYRNSYITSSAGNNIQEMGISFGIGLPIGRYNPYTQTQSRVNFGFQAGKRGSLADGLLENYYGLRVGVSLNDIWFRKRQVR